MFAKMSLIGLLAGAALFVVGCGAQPGKTVISIDKLDNLDTPRTQEATEDGVYKLYTNFGATPVTTVPLKAHDTIGFQKSPDGKIEGVAGSSTQDLGKLTSGAMWKLEK